MSLRHWICYETEFPMQPNCLLYFIIPGIYLSSENVYLIIILKSCCVHLPASHKIDIIGTKYRMIGLSPNPRGGSI